MDDYSSYLAVNIRDWNTGGVLDGRNIGFMTRLFGRGGNDTIYAGDSTIVAYGGLGKDKIIAVYELSTSKSDFFGGRDDDELIGSFNNDRLLGQADNDKLYGNGGNDYLLGGDGDDFLSGGKGRNWMRGGDGDDTFLSKGRFDTMTGGSGADEFQFRAEVRTDGNGASILAVNGHATITDFEAGDKIRLLGVSAHLNSADLSSYIEKYMSVQDGSLVIHGETSRDGKSDWTITLEGRADILADLQQNADHIGDYFLLG